MNSFIKKSHIEFAILHHKISGRFVNNLWKVLHFVKIRLQNNKWQWLFFLFFLAKEKRSLLSRFWDQRGHDGTVIAQKEKNKFLKKKEGKKKNKNERKVVQQKTWQYDTANKSKTRKRKKKCCQSSPRKARCCLWPSPIHSVSANKATLRPCPTNFLYFPSLLLVPKINVPCQPARTIMPFSLSPSSRLKKTSYSFLLFNLEWRFIECLICLKRQSHTRSTILQIDNKCSMHLTSHNNAIYGENAIETFWPWKERNKGKWTC